MKDGRRIADGNWIIMALERVTITSLRNLQADGIVETGWAIGIILTVEIATQAGTGMQVEIVLPVVIVEVATDHIVKIVILAETKETVGNVTLVGINMAIRTVAAVAIDEIAEIMTELGNVRGA